MFVLASCRYMAFDAGAVEDAASCNNFALSTSLRPMQSFLMAHYSVIYFDIQERLKGRVFF